MKKSELIEQLATELKQNLLTYHDVQYGVDVILECLSNSLSLGDRIEVRDFGSFTLHYRKAHVARNPKNGSSVDVPEKHVPSFRPSQELKRRANNLL